jgi:uncharacterized protein
VSTEQSLGMAPEPRLPSAIAGLETFSLSDPRDDEPEDEPALPSAESLFNLPAGGGADDDEDDDLDPRDRR